MKKRKKKNRWIFQVSANIRSDIEVVWKACYHHSLLRFMLAVSLTTSPCPINIIWSNYNFFPVSIFYLPIQFWGLGSIFTVFSGISYSIRRQKWMINKQWTMIIPSSKNVHFYLSSACFLVSWLFHFFYYNTRECHLHM